MTARRPLLLALLLLLVLATPAVAQTTATARATVSPPSGDLATPFTFAWNVPIVRGEQVLDNPTFARGLDAWAVSDAGIDRSATFVTDDRGLLVRVPRAMAPGSVTVSQSVPLVADAYEVEVDATVTGTLLDLRLVLRETRGGVHHDTAFRLTGEGPQRVAWAPRDLAAESVEVIVEARFAGGDSAEIRLASVRMDPVTGVRWDFGDGTATGTSVVHRFAAEGRHNVTATRTDPDGRATSVVVAANVRNAVPVARLDLVRLDGSARFVADASSSTDPDGTENRLVNPTFDNGTSGWTFSSHETGTLGRMDAVDGALRLRVDTAARTGTVFAWQNVPILADRPHVFSVLASDQGGIEAYEMILRETGSTSGRFDHVHRFAPTHGPAAELSFSFTPRYADSTHLVVHLRAVVPAGATADVTFDDVRLRDDLTYSWRLDGKALPDARSRIDFVPGLGNHTLEVTVQDAAGRTAVNRTTFNATLPRAAPMPAILPPSFALVGQPADFYATPSRPSAQLERLSASAWTPHATGRLVLDDEYPAAAQRVPVEPGSRYEWRLRHALIGEGSLQLILREQTLDRDGHEVERTDTVLELNATATPTEARGLWRAADPDTTHLTLILLRHGADAVASVDAVSFSTAHDYTWTVDRTPERSAFGLRHNFTRAGTALVTLAMTGPDLVRNATSIQVPVLEPASVRATPLLAGGVELRWNLTLHPSFEAFVIERESSEGTERTTLAPAREGRHHDAAPPTGIPLEYRLYVVTTNGTEALVANRTLALAHDAPVGAVTAPESLRRFTSGAFTVAAPADATRVMARVTYAGRTVDTLEFEEGHREWTAEWEPGFFAFPGAYTVVVEATGAAGETTILGQPALVQVTVLDGHGALVVLAALLLPSAAFAVRQARAGRWRR